jgi:putative transposase
MPRRDVPLTMGRWFHVYNRGHNRDDIFFERENYLFFLQRLREHVTTNHARIAAYVLMPNHFHLLLQPLTDGVSAAMQRFSISYTKAINKRHGRVGTLFQGAFRAKPVDEEIYLVHLSRYLHLNPIRARIETHPRDWEFSSYREYCGLRAGTLPDLEPIRRYFTSQGHQRSEFVSAYQAFVDSYHPSHRKIITHLLFSSL